MVMSKPTEQSRKLGILRTLRPETVVARARIETDVWLQAMRPEWRERPRATESALKESYASG